MPNKLFYGDNLEVLQRHPEWDGTVDLVYLDPPFNSNRTYNVLFAKRGVEAAHAQIQAFDDTWGWSQDVGNEFRQLVAGGVPNEVAATLQALHGMLGENDVLAYLVMMTPRLVELRKKLKASGSIYLHCDPTTSHYLKIVMDAVFGAENFKNEIVWKRFNFHADARRFGRITDRILFYTKSDQFEFNDQRVPFSAEYEAAKFTHTDDDGRRFRLSDLNPPAGRGPIYEFNGVRKAWRITEENMRKLDAEGRIYKGSKIAQLKRYLDELDGQAVPDLWDDISPINPMADERLGYPTQKPVALLKRIVSASSSPGQLVLDPFCGCGTTIEAAQELGRQWIGIDITYIAVDLIQKRLRHRFTEAITATFEVDGIPRDLGGARALFGRSPFDFERWAVSLVDGTPNQRQVGDRGIDGIARFPLGNDPAAFGKALISVKGGEAVAPTAVRDLLGTMETQHAEMGILIAFDTPTRGVKDAIDHSGTYTSPLTGTTYPRVQVLTVDQLLGGTKPRMPTPLLPYIKAERLRQQNQLTLGT